MSFFRKLTHSLVPKWLRFEVRYHRELRGKLKHKSRLNGKVKSYSQHTLPGSLIVNLTSYPARFRSLHLTVQSLLDQVCIPDEINLWIAHEDMCRLPSSLRNLTKHRHFKIRTSSDIRSYKKLVPALIEFPRAFLAIADDDVYYHPTWLAEMVETWHRVQPRHSSKIIVCHRAHRFPQLANGGYPTYRSWQKNVQPSGADPGEADLIPTGVGGVLYPPGSLHADVVDVTKFMELAPTGDDLWFYWMARKAQSIYAKTPDPFQIIEWPGVAETALSNINAGSAGVENDRQVANLLHAYGPPN